MFAERQFIVADTVPSDFTFRKIKASDKERSKELHEICLPVRYDDSFYSRITSPRSTLYTAVCEHNGFVVGVAVARVESQWKAREKGLVMCSTEGKDLLYIMTLVVDPDYRKKSIGTRLIEFLSSEAPRDVQAIYLHVLDTNEGAVRFYEANQFRRVRKLKSFYRINSKLCDSFVYVHYINNGKPPQAGISNWCLQWAYCLSENCPFVEDVPSCVLLYNNLLHESFAWCRAKISLPS